MNTQGKKNRKRKTRKATPVFHSKSMYNVRHFPFIQNYRPLPEKQKRQPNFKNSRTAYPKMYNI
jgi:hypothetical protein